MTREFRFIDLFAGIGGMRLGFESVGGNCVLTSEWNKFARQTYSKNFESGASHSFVDDVRQIVPEAIPPFEVLVAGFPCQPFSIAGVSKKNALGRPHGFADETQGTLFFDIERLLRTCEPKAFLLENVKNLRSHDGGRTFRVIRTVLEQRLGYRVGWRILDAKGLLPQHRERIFIVGFRPDVFQADAVQESLDSLLIPPDAGGPTLRSVLHGCLEDETPEAPYSVLDPRGKVRAAPRYTLTLRLWEYLKGYAAKHRAKGNGFGFGLVGPDDISRTLSARYYKDGSEILIQQSGRGRPRRLTPRECARLMGFDNDKRQFQIPVSDTQAYRQFGNAVAVPLVTRIAGLIKSHLDGTVKIKGARPKQTALFERSDSAAA